MLSCASGTSRATTSRHDQTVTALRVCKVAVGFYSMESPSATLRIVFRTGQLVGLLAVLHKYARVFYQIGEVLSSISMIAGAAADSRRLERESQQLVIDRFRKIRTLSDQVGLILSVKHADRILSDQKMLSTYGELKQAAIQLQDRIRDELDTVYFLHVPFEKAKVYYNSHPFEESVSNKFPNAITDIQEASKCLAVGRFTGCVFHLMRVMEIGVQHLGKKLKLKNTHEHEWQTILNNVNGAIKKLGNPPTPITSKQKAARNKYAQAAVYLENVKNAWRNNVMHPKASYTPEEAEEVFRTVNAYMQHLATIL